MGHLDSNCSLSPLKGFLLDVYFDLQASFTVSILLIISGMTYFPIFPFLKLCNFLKITELCNPLKYSDSQSIMCSYKYVYTHMYGFSEL